MAPGMRWKGFLPRFIVFVVNDQRGCPILDNFIVGFIANPPLRRVLQIVPAMDHIESLPMFALNFSKAMGT
jgi:hypothetical protein